MAPRPGITHRCPIILTAAHLIPVAPTLLGKATRTTKKGERLVTETRGIRVTYAQDWTAYNAAATTEKEQFCRLLRDLCANVSQPEQGRGRPRLPLSDMLFAAGFKVYSTVSGRRFMTDLRAACDQGLIAKAPHYNSIFNVIAAAWRIELGDILARKFRHVAQKAIDELIAVAAADGVTVRPTAIEHCWTFCEKYPTFKTSTQQDLARGRQTEWEALSAELIRVAEKHGIGVPTHEMMLDKLKQATASASQSKS